MHKTADIEPGTLLQDRLVVVTAAPSPAFAASLRQVGARDVLFIPRAGPREPQRAPNYAVGVYDRLKSVRANNCSVALLHGYGAAALTDRETLARFSFILVPMRASLALAVPGLLRHLRSKRVAISGRTRLTIGDGTTPYLVLRSSFVSLDNRRQYGTTGLSPLDVIRRLDGLNYIVLRWPEEIEAGRHDGDIDILVAPDDAVKVAERYKDAIATYPLDVYSEDGSGGFYFNRAPYYTPDMARRMLHSASSLPSGLRITTPIWRYLSFGYHLLLHIKSRRVPPGTNSIGPQTFRSPKYFEELQRLAKLAGMPPPATFDDIESALKRAEAWPGVDLMGFYAEKNRFLQHRYIDAGGLPPGLMTLFVRDFGAGLKPVASIREIIASKFEILAEGQLPDDARERIVDGVRGGNWSESEAPGGQAYPVYWFVCWDRSPTKPSWKTKRKRPRVDNENTNLKYEIRERVGVKVRKQQRLIHTSDNTAEALEHVGLLGRAEALRHHPVWTALKLP